MFRRSIHSFLTRFVLVCLHEIVRIQNRETAPKPLARPKQSGAANCAFKVRLFYTQSRAPRCGMVRATAKPGNHYDIHIPGISAMW